MIVRRLKDEYYLITKYRFVIEYIDENDDLYISLTDDISTAKLNGKFVEISHFIRYVVRPYELEDYHVVLEDDIDPKPLNTTSLINHFKNSLPEEFL